MKKENWLKKQICEGKVVKAMWAELASEAIVEAAVYAGWNAIVIDNEHGPADLMRTANMMRAIESAGGHPIIRVPWNDEVYLKRILDLGAQSIMVPMICDLESAQYAADSCLYPPLGKRGYAAPIVRASQYGANPNYVEEAKDELFLMAQIEHKKALDHIDDIASVTGIDMLFLGPNDLAGSIGKLEQLADQDAEALSREAEQKITATGKSMGTVLRPIPDISGLVENGHQFIVTSVDTSLFANAARDEAKTYQQQLENKH